MIDLSAPLEVLTAVAIDDTANTFLRTGVARS